MDTIRDRGWRRHKSATKRKARLGQPRPPFKGGMEKKFGLLYIRHVKLKRAQRLGFEYPRRSVRQCLNSGEWGDINW
ncbi:MULTISPECIES: hypothetical protein [Kordiimonas]|jgi:hypothetical protein|uniref:hypothetical protein n=1 Tax=Kordiimonas TaxID=288021 RepID=UPI0025811980|nr:hypothetical protein [Kordiimonas sp. UBA4487]